MSGKSQDINKRFWSKVTIADNGCWEWIAGLYSNGYGQFSINKRKICAHRFSYILKNGTISDELNVCHKCDNRKCVNPDHLFLGSQEDNMRDMINKNRKVNADKRGALNGRASLTEQKVLEMRSLYKKGTSIVEIARRFDTSETQTARIVKLQSWKHI